jgi:D-beta-D-heptose 7-phosphate kinase/D-beta-D-heptose 1-phosphate adenosyltransferase
MPNLDNFEKVSVLVVGDVMIDKYLWGDVTRISPEAPVPVVNLRETTFRAGGAANVAANIVGLGASAFLVGITGNDAEGQIFAEVLEKAGVSAAHIFKSNERVTTTKTRIMAHNQQIARLDQESSQKLSHEEEENLWEKIQSAAQNVNVFVISDYAKGVLSEKLLKRLIILGNILEKLVVVDPKGRDYSKYKNATMITPNKFEIAEACGCRADDFEEITRAAQSLIEELKLKSLIVTRGEEGVTLFEKGGKFLTKAAVGRTVFDVTGAGDTFIATLAVALGAGNDAAQATEFANAGAGLAVEELGTTVINLKALKTVFKESHKQT